MFDVTFDFVVVCFFLKRGQPSLPSSLYLAVVTIIVTTLHAVYNWDWSVLIRYYSLCCQDEWTVPVYGSENITDILCLHLVSIKEYTQNKEPTLTNYYYTVNSNKSVNIRSGGFGLTLTPYHISKSHGLNVSILRQELCTLLTWEDCFIIMNHRPWWSVK